MNENWESVISESHLISLPDVYIKLQQLLANDDYALADVAEIIGFDPALTARLLRMVNSSYFGLAAQIDTISRAINYLGAQQVNDLVLSTSIAETFSDIDNPTFNLYQFWQQSIYCAIAARELAVHCNVLDSERLFVAGLLHKIGHLMMCQAIPELTLQAQQQSVLLLVPLPQAQQEVIGFDYTRVGSELLDHWKLPQSLVETVKYQLRPGAAQSNSFEASIVHIAAAMANAFDQQSAISVLPSLEPFAVERCEFTDDKLGMIEQQVMESLAAVSNLLFPQLKASGF